MSLILVYLYMNVTYFGYLYPSITVLYLPFFVPLAPSHPE